MIRRHGHATALYEKHILGELKPRLTNLLQDKDPAEQDNIIFQVSWINIFLNQV